MKYKKVKQIARLSFFGEDALEGVNAPYSTLTFGLFDLTQIPLSDKAYISIESVNYQGGDKYVIRCNKFASELIYWDSSTGCRGIPILYSNINEQNVAAEFINPDPMNLYKFPISKNFFNNTQIKFDFDEAIETEIKKNRFSVSFIVFDEEEDYTETNTEVGKDDWKVGKSFPKVY